MATLVVVLAVLVVCAIANPALDPQKVIVRRAYSIVNKSSAEYLSNQVLNYAIYGNKNMGGNCASYRLYGVACAVTTKLASVVISKDGSNCAIIVAPTLFEYTSASKGKVTLGLLTAFKYVFPNGYDIRCYSGNGTVAPSTIIRAPVRAPMPPVPMARGPSSRSNSSTVADVVRRALAIVGQPSTQYLSNQVVNYAVFGNKLQGGTCASYRTWGVPCTVAKPATVAIAKNNGNCGIFTAINSFEFTSGSKNVVVQVQATQLKYVFPTGYDLRCFN